MEITRVKPPKFKVGRYSLNEYEVRTLMLEVARGEKPAGSTVKDARGNTATINPNGTLSANLHGLDALTSLKMDLVRAMNA